MIVTNAGKAGVNNNDQVTIDKVMFSDFRLNNISDYEQQQITAIQGINTISVNPTVALLSNGHALVQASVAANFNVNSVFILATGNDSEFLLAVTESNGSLSEELNIDAIRRLTFNATANNLVMKSDVSSLVASAVSALPSSSDDASSYADDAYNRANNYTNSYVDGKLNANLNLDSTYANQAYSSATSYTDSRLATKVDAAELNNYASQSELSNYATNSALADYATSSNVDSVSITINSQLANKADIGSLIPFATQSSVDEKMNTKADVTQLSNYVTSESANDQFSTINSTVATKANLADLSSYATSSALTILSSQVINGLNSKADNVSLTSVATSLVNSANGSFNAIQLQFSNTPNDAVKDNHNGTISFNGFNLSFRRVLDPHEDIFNLSPGAYKSLWGYQDSLKNYPSPNGAATVIVYGTDTAINNGMKIVVIDTWGGEYQTRWNVTKFDDWQKVISYAEMQANDSKINSFSDSASSHIAFLQSKADTDAGNIINNNKLINSLAAEIDSLKSK